jgi:hypothetical protein
MNSTSSTSSDETLVPLAAAASRFGYSDSQHWRQVVAPRNGIRPVQQGVRWFVPQRDLDRALAALTKTSNTPTT